MKSLYTFLIALLISINICQGQVAYYDAVTLEKFLDPAGQFPTSDCGDPENDPTCEEFINVINLIRPYLNETLQKKDAKTIVISISDSTDPNYNPFLARMFPNMAAMGAMNRIDIGSLTTKAVSSLGGMDVTTFAQGLAAFLVDRAKEELNVAFFQRLESVLKAYPEFAVLFPHTQTFLNNYEAWQYANLLETLREAFDKDLKNILSNSIELRDLTEASCIESEMSKNAYNNCTQRLNHISQFFKTDEGLGLLTALKLGDALNSGEKIPDAFNAVVNEEFLLGINFGGRVTTQQNFASFVKLLNIVSMSLRSNEVTRQYISSNEFNMLFVPLANNNLQKIYLGLLYQQILNAKIVITVNGTSVNVAEEIARKANDTRQIIIYLKQIRDMASDLEVAYTQLVSDITHAKEDLSKSRMAFFMATTRTVAAIGNVEIIDPRFQLSAEVSNFFALTNQALSIIEDINSKKYNAALISLIRMMDDRLQMHMKASGGADLFPHFREFTAALLKYGSFAANVVNAKDADGVKDAIKAIALPAGSASIKKGSNWSVSVNAYVGFVYGKEGDKTVTATMADGTMQQRKLHGNRALSVYAPVGLAVNKGLWWRGRHPWSVSVFASIIDVGALVGYRFTNDSTFTGTPKIKLENIFAPGGNIAIGLPNMPLTIGAGVQRIAMLDRDPGTNEVYTTNVASWRPQIFLAIDIPVIHLFTDRRTLLNTKKKK